MLLPYLKAVPVGVCLHTGDFKIDMSPIDNQFMDLNRISELGQQGVLLATLRPVRSAAQMAC